MDLLSIATTMISGLGGGALRMAPEILNFFDKKNEREHELALQDKQIQLAQLQQEGKLKEIASQTESQVSIGQMQALIEATKGQMQLTGSHFIDGMSMLVRPITTYYMVGMWGLKKTAEILLAMQDHSALTALVNTWTDNDQAMLTGVLTFWFIGRVFEKR